MLAGVRRVPSLWRQQFPLNCFSSQVQPIQMAFNAFESPDNDTNAPPLIIMHGLFGSKQNWRGIGRALEHKLKRKIFTVDARNHGDSPHTASHDSELMAADVIEFMRQKGIPKSCVMGHSMGGRTMMYLALKYPEYIDRSIIVDISPIAVPRDFSHMESIFTALKNVSVPSELPMAAGRVVAVNQIKEAVGDPGTVDFIVMNLKKRETGEFFWAVNLEALQNSLSQFPRFMEDVADLPPSKNPMMFICGKRSNFVE